MDTYKEDVIEQDVITDEFDLANYDDEEIPGITLKWNTHTYPNRRAVLHAFEQRREASVGGS